MTSRTAQHDPSPGRGLPSSEYSGQGAGAPGLADRLAGIARQLDTEQGVDATLHALVAAAVGVIPGADSAGITQVHKSSLTLDVAYASDPFVVDLDAAQAEVGEGPCLYSAYAHRTVRVDDFATEQRWPAFARRARELGAGSQLALQLYVDGEDMAALNVYSRRARAFDDEAEQVGLLFAAHAAIAMAGARREHQFRAGLDSRDVIGQAKGILMERFKITADQAFQVLVRASSEANIKLHEVARTLAGGTELPAPPMVPTGQEG